MSSAEYAAQLRSRIEDRWEAIQRERSYLLAARQSLLTARDQLEAADAEEQR